MMTFEPHNNLESKLILAANDPSSRPDFYRELIVSDVFMIQVKDDDHIHEGVLKEGSTVQLLKIEMDGKLYIPIFSSLLRLQEFIKEEVSYLSMNSIDFFKLTLGANVILNHGASFGKEFNKREIESILNGSILTNSNNYEVKKDTQIMIGQPAVSPVELIQGLSKLFARIKEIKCAYNAHFYNPEMDEKPHTLIAIETYGNWNEIMTNAGMVVETVKIPDPPVDFIQLNEKSELDHYFKSTCKPFYKKKILGLF